MHGDPEEGGGARSARPPSNATDDDSAEHPIARGRKTRESREDLNPKLTRSSGSGSTPTPIYEEASPEDSERSEEEQSPSLVPEHDDVAVPRSSTVAARQAPDDSTAADSAEAPLHPIAHGRKERASREEMAKLSRPPPRKAKDDGTLLASVQEGDAPTPLE